MGFADSLRSRSSGAVPTGPPPDVGDDGYQQYWNAVFRNDPEMQSIFADVNAGDYGARRGQKQQEALAEVNRRRAAGEPVDAQLSFDAYSKDFKSETARERDAVERARALGWEAPRGGDWSVDIDDKGFRVERKNFLNRNQEWLIPAVMGGAAGVAGLAGGGIGAAGGGASGVSAAGAAPTLGGVAASGSVPAGLGGAGAALGAAPTVAGAAGGIGAGTTAAGAGSSMLGKLGGLFGGGGKFSQVQDILSGVGQVSGAIGAGRAAGRQAEHQQGLEDALLQHRLYNDQSQLDLQRKDFTMQAPQRRAMQVALADILQNVQPIKMKIPGIPDYESTGGLNLGLLTDFARNAAKEFGTQANTALFDKSDTKFSEMPSTVLPSAPKPGRFDSLMNILGTAGGLAGAIPSRSSFVNNKLPANTGITPGSVTVGPNVGFGNRTTRQSLFGGAR